MINIHEVIETNDMIEKENLDVRTITMGISLLDCIDSDLNKVCDNIYNKITSMAKDLVKVGEEISMEYGIPIVNKRISVTPIALVGGAACKKPEDFVIATGVQHSVREFVELAFKYVGIELEFRGEGMDEKGYSKITGRCLVEVSSDFYRPTDVVNLLGDPTKAKNKLGWNPNRTSFEELVRLMVENDMKKVAIERQSEKVTKNLVEYLDNGIVI